jgi:hypothetical protein
MSRLNDHAPSAATQTDAPLPAGPAARPGPGPDRVILMALKVWGYREGEVVSLMIHLGDRLGLYRALDVPAR